MALNLTPEDISALSQAFKNAMSQSQADAGPVGAMFANLTKSGNKSAKALADATLAQRRVDKAYEQSTKGILGATKAMRDFEKGNASGAEMAVLAAKQMQNLTKDLDDVQLEKAAQLYKEELIKAGDAHSLAIAEQIHSARDMLAIQQELEDNKLGQAKEIFEAFEAGKISSEEAGAALEQLGYETEDLGRGFKHLEERTLAQAKATAKVVREMEGGMFQSLQRFGKGVVAGASALWAISKPAIEVAKSAARTGTQMETLNAVLMGMSPEELNQLQADHRRIMLSSNDTFDTFNEKIREGSVGLITYTGSLRDANRLNAEAYANAKVLGADQMDFMTQQADVFKKLNRTVSMTAEQFMDMNKQLMDSSAVQSMMYKISVKQRAAHFQELQNTYEKLTLDGLTHEQAMRMLDTFEAIGAKSPKERLKEAAKLQAVMGAMGMGAEGARAGELMRQGKTGTPEFAELMKQANIGVGEKMGQGFASELMTMTMIQSAGLDQYLGPQSEFAAFNTRQEAAISEDAAWQASQTQLGGERNNLLREILRANDVAASALTGPIGQTIASIYASVTALKLMGAGGGIGGLATKGGGKWAAAKSGAAMLGKKIPIIGGLLAGGLAGAETYGALEGTDYTESQKATIASATGTGAGVGAGGGALAGAAAGAAIGSVVPVIGTAIGGILGGILGGMGGEMIGKWAGEKAGEAMAGEAVTTLAQEAEQLQSRIASQEAEIAKYQGDKRFQDEYLAAIEKQTKLTEDLKKLNEEIKDNTKQMDDRVKETKDKIMEQTEAQNRNHQESMDGKSNNARIYWALKTRPTAME